MGLKFVRLTIKSEGLASLDLKPTSPRSNRSTSNILVETA